MDIELGPGEGETAEDAMGDFLRIAEEQGISLEKLAAMGVIVKLAKPSLPQA